MVSHRSHNTARAGMALVLGLFLVFVLVSLAVAFACSANMGLQQSRNHRLVSDARMTAESGLAFYGYLVRSVEVSGSLTGQAILDSLAATLGERLNGSPTFQGGSLQYDGSTIVMPPVSFVDRRSFTAGIAIARANTLRLSVTGEVFSPAGAGSAVRRSVSIEFAPEFGVAFGYGVYAKGPITVGENANFTGVNDPSEASICSAAGGVAISVESGYISGDVVTCDPQATVNVGATIGGDVYTIDEPPEPEINGSIFEPFATNTVDSDTDTSSGTFTNVRVKAGTNPLFGSGVTIQGVMYIETPNVVQFTGEANITGVIVSEDPGEAAPAGQNAVSFKNNLTLYGVDELPAVPEFDELRGMTGSAFLLPGFTLDFKNNFTAIGGTVAAKEILLKNNLDGKVYGSVLVLGDGGLTLKNNSAIAIDRSKYPGGAAGMGRPGPQKLVFRASTYTEY
ncbi:MAG: hypothetical protein WBF17_14720 [Phycisphaerae bacterium]